LGDGSILKTTNVLVIGGSDSIAGAGIQADLKTITYLGGYAVTVVTAITAQNSSGISKWQSVDLDLIEAQIKVVASDLEVMSVKVGMLANSAVVELLEREITYYGWRNIVLDPVVASHLGQAMVSEDTYQAIVEKLFPLASLVTPNTIEASKFTSSGKIYTLEEMKKSARQLVKMGAKSVLVKGGHGQFPGRDIFYDGVKMTILDSQNFSSQPVHGTGCVLASAAAFFLANSGDVYQAVKKAKAITEEAIVKSIQLGRGQKLSLLGIRRD
jgi:hydroxymethylpyrimidine/phosphomethylpyrimidine kinase